MDSKIVIVTMQGAMISALSSSIAQAIKVWNHQKLSVVDPVSLLILMVISIIITPMNFLYGSFLEQLFPTNVSSPTPVQAKKKDDEKPESQMHLSIPNIAAKFFLEQSLGAAVNVVMFIFLFGIFNGKNLSQIAMDVKKEFWPSITAGWKVWPIVTLLNLVVVPFDYRSLVGNTAGVLFGVYMSLKNT